jgi:hypothetical protein
MATMRMMLVASATALGMLALAACSNEKKESMASSSASAESKSMSTTQSAAMAPMSWSATLDGKSEVPATPSPGTGTAAVSYDEASKTLTWDIAYEGLTGEPKAAHFHGPAAPGANAGVQVDIGKSGLASPMQGTAQLTDQQAAGLKAGQWYINIHTAKYPDGEIRGQVMSGM